MLLPLKSLSASVADGVNPSYGSAHAAEHERQTTTSTCGSSHNQIARRQIQIYPSRSKHPHHRRLLLFPKRLSSDSDVGI
jgi:hypothetical protein